MTTYRISELAQRVGLKATTLRFYEQAGLLPARRSPSGYRLYGDEAVDRLDVITSGKHLGLPLEDIREVLRVWEDGWCADVRAQLRPLLLARLADAEQRTAELQAFTERLHRALADLDGPAAPGRCDQDCGFPHRPTTPPPAPQEHTSDSPPIACTLAAGDRDERLTAWRRLLDGVAREDIGGDVRGVRFHLPAESAGRVGELAVAEQQCCAFLDITLRPAGTRLVLEVRAPAGAHGLFEDIFGGTGSIA